MNLSEQEIKPIKIITNTPHKYLNVLNDKDFYRELKYTEIANIYETIHNDGTLLELYSLYKIVHNKIAKIPQEKAKLVFKIYKNYIYQTLYREYRKTPLKLKDNKGYSFVYTETLPDVDLSLYDEEFLEKYKIKELAEEIDTFLEKSLDDITKLKIYKLNLKYNIPMITSDINEDPRNKLMNGQYVKYVEDIPEEIDNINLNFDYVYKLNYPKYQNDFLNLVLKKVKIKGELASKYYYSYPFIHLLFSKFI